MAALSPVIHWGLITPSLTSTIPVTTDHRAAAVTTGYFFQDKLKSEPTTSILKNIEYDVNSTQNASVMFEVLGVNNGMVSLRGQAHIYDKNGNYRYDYEDYFQVAQTNPNITFFADDNGANGLTFANFDFTDVSRLKHGDKLSLFLAADADVMVPSTDDEVFLFAQGDRRNMYPFGWRFNDNVLDQHTTPLRTFQVNYDTGDVYDGELKLTFEDFHGGAASGVAGSISQPTAITNTVSFNSEYRHGVDLGTAHLYTKLKDIKEFWDASGNFLLATPQTLQLTSNGKTADLTLYAGDTVMDMMDKLNAVMYQEFGQQNIMDSQDQYKFARLIDTAQTGRTYESTAGTLVLRTAVAGQSGEVTFHGNDDLLNAFGMQVVRTSQENQYRFGYYQC